MPMNKGVMKFMSMSHAFWYQITGGVIGAKVSGMPVLLLTTTGRKSGRKHTTPLTHQRDGETYVLIGSNSGHDNHPDWYLNLRSHPHAEIQIGREHVRVRAETAGDEDRTRLFASAVAVFPGYGEYQQGTKRKMPVVILRPASS